MGREWQIGDPVDYTTDGWMDAQNWGHGNSDDDDEDERPVRRKGGHSQKDEYLQMAWDCYMDFRDEEALHYINLSLEWHDRNPRGWNIKAIILESLERYGESEECYNRALELSPNSLFCDNKARMLKDWAFQLIEESKRMPDGRHKLAEAQKINERAINALPGENSEENIENYLDQKNTIAYCMNYEREFRKNLEALKSYPKDELFTIAGMHFYRNDVELVPGMSLKLVKEPENEFDGDAIAVYANDEKVGYVANSINTKCVLTSSASELKDRISDIAKGSYLLYLQRYSDIQYAIGRIIKD